MKLSTENWNKHKDSFIINTAALYSSYTVVIFVNTQEVVSSSMIYTQACYLSFHFSSIRDTKHGT
jgi:hypothetical protein